MANDKTNYSEKIEELLKEMPDFVSDYIYNFMNGENPSTMLQYTRDILDFLRFMVNSLPEYDDKTMKELTLEDLSKLNSLDVNRYLTFVRGSRDHRYTKERTDNQGNKIIIYKKRPASTTKRLRATLSSLFSFFMTSGKLTSNPASARNKQRKKEQKLIYLNDEEQAKRLNTVRTGENMKGKAAAHHGRFAVRDSAMILLLLDTGLRVSEMLTTNIADYELDDCSVVVTRKGGDTDTVYYSDECKSYLQEYFSAQRTKYNIDDKEIPAFTTLKGERLGVRAVENLVKKYAEFSLGSAKGKTITPHKLRSSFAMSFYQESDKDILLLKEMLHHSSINTTNIYAKASPGQKKEARNLLQNRRKNK